MFSPVQKLAGRLPARTVETLDIDQVLYGFRRNRTHEMGWDKKSHCAPWARVESEAQDMPSNPEIDAIVDELLKHRLPKPERIKLLKEMIRRGDELPDEVLDFALKRMMERLLD